MTLLERIRSPSRRALRDAGPRDRDVLAGAIVSGLLIAVGWWAGPLRDVPWPAWAAIPVVILTAIAVADRDGWRIRRAMAYVAIRQRARWTRGRIPTTPSLARQWLLDPANAGASGAERASVQFMAGDIAAASATLDAYHPTGAVELASRTRMLAVVRARGTGLVDLDAIRRATEGLTGDERRYQLTAASFSQVWLDVEAGRPWRIGFAHAVRELGPHPVPPHIAAMIGVQEMAAPIAVALATAIMGTIVGW